MRRFRHSTLIVWLAFIALALQSLIPVGYMPDFDHPGQLVLCDGTDHHHHHKDGKGHTNDDVCPFAAGAIHGFAALKAPAVEPPHYIVAATKLPEALPSASNASFGNASPRSPPTAS